MDAPAAAAKQLLHTNYHNVQLQEVISVMDTAVNYVHQPIHHIYGAQELHHNVSLFQLEELIQ
jgi:hypothetical protein